MLGLGCAGSEPPTRSRGDRVERTAEHKAEAPASTAQGKDAAGKPPAAGEQPAAVPRKIIYTASIELVVEDFAQAERDLLQLVKAQQGFVARSDTRGNPGSQRTGTWTVRIPVEHFEAFLEAAAQLGQLERSNTDSQDVTEEYYDLEARLKNKRVEEARLLQHLEKSTGKLEEILQVEKEISRVRGEIEQLQGRVQRLTNLTTLTTITVTIQERKGYVPPTAPSFGTTVRRTFERSVLNVREFGEGFVLVAVALTPWLPVLAVGGVPLWMWRRRRARRRAAGSGH